MVSEPTEPRAAPAGDERGYVAVVAGLLIFILAVMAALAVDVGRWNNVADRAQRAADNASLGAVSELVRVERTTGDRALAETAATTTAEALAKENGFDVADPDVNVGTTIWTDANGVDHVTVTVTENDLELTFSKLVTNDKDISRQADAALHNCQATCGDAVLIPNAINGFIDTKTFGDGWIPVLVDNLVFNVYHHKSSNHLFCTDRFTQAACTGIYPTSPYPDMFTHYGPVLTPVGHELYLVVQRANDVGLGCWDSTTHSRCAGFASPLILAPHRKNNEQDSVSRLAGPELVGTRLFMYGDDNRMYCYDTATAGVCGGYPRATPLLGVHDMPLRDSAMGITHGTDSDEGQQFDMLTTAGGQIYTTLTPADNATWIGCWDTNTDAACAGWPLTSTANGRPWLFFHYTTSGVIDGVCARAGNRGGSEVGTGHECFGFNGASKGSPVGYPFRGTGTDKAGQQSAVGVLSNGHTVTYFPFRNTEEARCWDWTSTSSCALAPSNWSGTEDYGYTSDGEACIFGLGHHGLLWSFTIETGQQPCQEAGVAKSRLEPCTCADGVSKRWTSLVLTPDTDLELFDKFLVTLTRPDGTVEFSVDLTTTNRREVPLTHLNDESPPPAYLDLVVDAEVKLGQEDVVFAVGNRPGVVLLPGIRPSLVN